MKSEVTIAGVKDVQRILNKLDKKHARKIARNTVRGIASRAAKLMKRNAPKDSGNLKSAIKARSSRSSPENPQAKVVIKEGKKKPAFYWYMIDQGTKNGLVGTMFATDAREQIAQELPRIVREEFVKKFDSAVKRELKAQARNLK